MKPHLIIFILLVSLTLHSCSPEDPLPTSGENSFIAQLNGEKFEAVNRTHFPGGISYGLTSSFRNNSWELSVTNASNKTISFYINNLFEPNLYLIEDGGRKIIKPNPAETPTSVVIRNSSLDLLFISASQTENEYIRITQVQGDSILVGEFDKITLIDPEDPNKTAILRNGKFNINRNTLNQLEQ